MPDFEHAPAATCRPPCPRGPGEVIPVGELNHALPGVVAERSFSAGLGAGRNLRLHARGERPLVFHHSRTPAREDPLRDVPGAQPARGFRPPHARASERSRVSGIERAVQICDHLLAVGRPLTAYDVSKALGAPMSTIYGVVDSLLRQDLLSRDGDGLLWFGPRLYHYGLAYGRSLNLLETASQEMRELEPAARRDRAGLRPRRRPYGGAGDGRAVRAFPGVVQGRHPGAAELDRLGPPPDRPPALGGADRADAPGGPALAHGHGGDRPGGAVPDRGGGADREAGDPAERSDFAVACIAAPICTPTGDCDATISVVLPEQKARERERTYSVAVQEAASRIERLLGWTA